MLGSLVFVPDPPTRYTLHVVFATEGKNMSTIKRCCRCFELFLYRVQQYVCGSPVDCRITVSSAIYEKGIIDFYCNVAA